MYTLGTECWAYNNNYIIRYSNQQHNMLKSLSRMTKAGPPPPLHDAVVVSPETIGGSTK